MLTRDKKKNRPESGDGCAGRFEIRNMLTNVSRERLGDANT